MNKKNKVLILLTILVVLILICRKLLVFDSINYKITVNKNNFKIKEINNKDNYYIEVQTKNSIFPIRIYKDFSNKKKIINDIYYYNDKNVECILPLIENETYIDMLCIKDKMLYDYNAIKGDNSKLDKYVETIDKYNIKKYENISSSTKKIGTTIYNTYNNFNKVVALTTYNGLIVNGEEINLFKKDVYNNKISIFIDDFYLIANYDDNYTFNYFYVVNINTKQINKLKVKEKISYDSYIQGIVDNKIYLYDKDNENQYEIDIKNNDINIVSDNNYVKYYTNNKWEKINKIKANKEVYFNYDTLDNNFTDYDYVKETSNYFYLFKKDGIVYKLYRVDKENINIYKYILDIPVTNISFNDNYLYYVYKNKLYYYSDETGLKILLENSELEFNDTIKYYIY